MYFNIKHFITKYGISIEVGLGTFTSPPSNSKNYLGDLNYWFRYNLGTWKRLSVNIINFIQHIEKFNNAIDLKKYLNK